MSSDLDLNKPKIKDRDYILKKITNKNNVRALFGFNPNESDSIISPSVTPPAYNETEKYGIIYTSKGGSSYINNTLKKYNLFEHENANEFADGFNKVFLSTLYPTPLETEEEVPEKYSEFMSIVNGKSHKDLIIVTRNPMYKWLSGIYQEIEMEYQSSNILYGILQNDYDVVIDGKFPNKLSNEILEKIVYKYLLGVMYRNGKIANAHAALYNQTFFLFLLNNKIDKSKLKILDIDDPECNMNKFFSSYNPEIIPDDENFLWTHRPRHEHILKGILNNESSSIKIKQMIRNEVGTDFYYYSLLKEKFKKNFVKNN